jgi:hypothetical protein
VANLQRIAHAHPAHAQPRLHQRIRPPLVNLASTSIRPPLVNLASTGIRLHRSKICLNRHSERNTATYPASGPETRRRKSTKLHPKLLRLGSWRLVHPMNDLFSEVCSILRGTPSLPIQLATVTGGNGAGSPDELTNTLSSVDCNKTPTVWNEATCSWPLLAPCGTVSMETDAKLRARKSRGRYAGAPYSWSPETLRTLGEHLRDSTTSTAALPPI